MATVIMESRLAEEDEKKPMVQSTHINLKVKRQDGIEVSFRMKRNAKLKTLMNAYSDKQSVETRSIDFLFDRGHLRPEQTPDELEMKEGDEIDAMLYQIGA